MRKTAAIIHGTGATPQSYWLPWLRHELEQQGYDVWAPALPDSNGAADFDLWLETANKTAPHKTFDLMIGHSAGVPFIMRLLSDGYQSRHSLCVAGFMKPLPNTTPDHPSYPCGFDISQIKKNGKSFTFIHADNDPWGCDVAQGTYMQQTLGGTLIICAGQGHFGSDKYDQPYKEFPLLLSHCLLPYPF